MMGVYDQYRNRVSTVGVSDEEAFSSNTKDAINQLFNDAPNYQSLTIGSQTVDARIIRSKLDTDRILTFKPSTEIEIGNYTTFYNKTWIIMTFTEHPLYPKATATWCTSYLKWKDKDGNNLSYPCVIQRIRKYADVKNNKYFIESDWRTSLQVQMNSDTLGIEKGLRLISNSDTFYVGGIDTNSFTYGSYGIIEFDIRYTPPMKTDDFVNSIADNTEYYKAFGNIPQAGDEVGW